MKATTVPHYNIGYNQGVNDLRKLIRRARANFASAVVSSAHYRNVALEEFDVLDRFGEMLLRAENVNEDVEAVK